MYSKPLASLQRVNIKVPAFFCPTSNLSSYASGLTIKKSRSQFKGLENVRYD